MKLIVALAAAGLGMAITIAAFSYISVVPSIDHPRQTIGFPPVVTVSATRPEFTTQTSTLGLIVTLLPGACGCFVGGYYFGRRQQ